MKRNVLLIEPNYKNKYPPMSLMKLATYHKRLGDNVTFFKGDLNKLVLENVFEALKKQLYANDSTIFWEKEKAKICEYLRTGKYSLLEKLLGYNTNPIIEKLFLYYRDFFRKKKYFLPEYRTYDRVCITTLFTFYWDITIETINFAKQLCKSPENVFVGGIMASILPKYVEKATGILPIKGPLDKPGILDPGNNMIIDTLPLDYSILEETDYHYPASNAYFAYMSRGCINKCPFCAVPILEPVYKDFLPISQQVKEASACFGAQKDLLLLDNNVLASSKFDEIIEDIKAAGFTKGATLKQPNLYEIAVKNLKAGINDRGYVKSCVKQFRELISKSDPQKIQPVYDFLHEHNLLEESTATKQGILETHDILAPYFKEFYEASRLRAKKRYVDFNQGIDSRLINDHNMEKLAEIPLRPVRIAFDHWSLRRVYANAVRTAARHGHTYLSNYILYNFDDKPLELYWRLKLNVELGKELGISIYSFPMKYHPIADPKYFSNRDYIGKYWNRKFIRAIQIVLNATKGKVASGAQFFYRAFGKDEEEFYKILYMPESMIMYRNLFEKMGLTQQWWQDFSTLSEEERNAVQKIIASYDLKQIKGEIANTNIQKVLEYYHRYRVSKQVSQNGEEKRGKRNKYMVYDTKRNVYLLSIETI